MEDFKPKGKVKPGTFVIGIVLILGLIYAAFGYFDVGTRITHLFHKDVASVTPDSRQTISVDPTSIPVSQVKAPDKTTDNPNVTIGIWTWQTEDGLIDAVGGTGTSGSHVDSCLAQAG